jgi:phosphoribosylglycinamide formyltransferase 2
LLFEGFVMSTSRTFGTPLSPSATKVMLLGSGELGKEVIISLQRLGVEVVAVDRYANAPGHQVAHRAYVIDMTNGDELAALIEQEKPDLVVPEIEAIATATLAELEDAGKITCIPTARAAMLTMNREGIRRLAAEELGLATSPYRFASSLEELQQACEAIGFPCVVKPVMSSSGKGQSKLDGAGDMAKAWDYAATGSRVDAGRVIVEGFVDFDYEITLLPCARSAPMDRSKRGSASRSGTGRCMATMWNRGSRRRWHRSRWSVRATSRPGSRPTSAGWACSASSCSSKATWCGSRK